MKSRSTILFVVGVVALASTTTALAKSLGRFNKKGNILIADQLNNRVIEVNPDTHAIVWQFGDGGSVAGPTTIFEPRDAIRSGSLTLIACAGDNRVISVNKKGRIVWQYGQAGVAGSGTNELNSPVCARFLRGKRYLITDQGNHRVIELTKKSELAWQYGTTGVSGSGSNQLSNPTNAERRGNNDTLIADTGNNRVIEVNRRGLVGLQITAITNGASLNGPASACHLKGPNTLIADSLNNRVIEVDEDGSNVFEYVTSARSGSVTDPNPTRAIRLKKGDTLISDSLNHQVILIDPAGAILFTFGNIGAAGSSTNELNTPCDAKVVGDFTGLTSPKSGGGGSDFGGGGFGPGF